MVGTPLLVVKIGGTSAENDALIKSLGGDLRVRQREGCHILLVHGGGITINEVQRKYDISPRFTEGLRQTSPQAMPLIDMALAGGVNKRLVRTLETAGIKAWGVSGADAGILLAESIEKSSEKNRTGRILSVDIRPLELLLGNGYTPVFAPPATDSTGRGININADEAALTLAVALSANQLVFISDVPGVLEADRVISHLTPGIAEEKINTGLITGGMIPKVRSATVALTSGVGSVSIGTYLQSGDLEKILSGLLGTRISSGGNK